MTTIFNALNHFRKPSIYLLFLVALPFNFIATHSQADIFSKGATTASLAIGTGSFFNQDYLILGGGIGYYVLDGLEVGIDIDLWTGGSPTITEVTPKLTYAFSNKSSLTPYAGVFYSRTYVENLNDSDSFGYKAGVLFKGNNGVYIGVGAVQSELKDCVETAFNNCTDSYPELTFNFAI